MYVRVVSCVRGVASVCEGGELCACEVCEVGGRGVLRCGVCE